MTPLLARGQDNEGQCSRALRIPAILERSLLPMNHHPSAIEPPRLLLVGTDDEIRKLRISALREAGYFPDCATEAGEAWCAICNHGYGLLLVDQKLSGSSGFRLILRMSRAHLTLPVILIVDAALPFEPRAHHRLQSLVVLTRPFDAAQLLATVLRALERDESFKHHRRTFALIDASSSSRSASGTIQESLPTTNRHSPPMQPFASAPTEAVGIAQ